MNIQTFLKRHHQQHIIVGLSGGVDSVVLLHLLAQARVKHGLTLTAVHIHHGLNARADEWADFCANLCAKWEILLHIKRVQVQPKQLGIEAAARVARYEALAEMDGDCVALAHHRDDQVETFFLAALRGSGVRGLAAMSYAVSGSLKIVRPLLPFSRAEIMAYAAEHQLPHIEDDSNHQTLYLRNWLRHQWLPPLYQRVPHADKHILAAIELLQDELILLNEINELDKNHIYQSGQFYISKWRELSPIRRQQQLMSFAKRHQLGTPRRVSVLNYANMLCHNDDGAQWSLPNGQVIAYRGILFALKQGWENDLAWRTPLSGCLKQLGNQGGLIYQTAKMGLPAHFWQNQTFTLRAANAHDMLPMKIGRKPVKKLLAQNGVPPFLRSHYPVLLNNQGECVAVVGLAVNQQVAVADGYLPMCADLQSWFVPMQAA